MGKFSEKLTNLFNGRDDDYDDYDDDDFYDDEIDEDEIDEPEEKSSFFKKKAAPASDVRESRFSAPAKAPVSNVGSSRTTSASRSARNADSRTNGNEVCVIKPSSFEDAKEIIETLLSGKAVVVNFEGLHLEISQRIIDIIYGACYALDGNLQKISNYIFIATPHSVEITGDFLDLYGGGSDGSFDLSGFSSPLL